MSKERILTAFGEAKSLKQWANDDRCEVSDNTLRIRLLYGWSPEEAVSRPLGKTQRRSPFKMLTAFGETKSQSDWSRDERCVVSYHGLVNRIVSGWDTEEALTTPIHESLGTIVKAFGEAKSVIKWSEDERCVVGYSTLQRRLREGMEPEKALTQVRKSGRPTKHLLTAFNETKTLSEWANDERCVVQISTLYRRIGLGWEPEKALTKQSQGGRPAKHLLTAFNETKTLSEWLADDRCSVTYGALQYRLERGLKPEVAITSPSQRKL